MDRDPVAIDHVRISIEQVLTKALADVLAGSSWRGCCSMRRHKR